MPQTIKFNCPKCNIDMEASDADSGKNADCPNCGCVICIPQPRLEEGLEIGGFLIEKKLGVGGMGEVWLAHQSAMDRKVALKILSPSFSKDKEFLDRFIREVKTSAKLIHPNIVTAFDAGVDKGMNYLAVAFIDGTDLSKKLHETGRFPEKEALRIVRGIAEGLAYAWNKFKILHRDIKPANIMLDSDGVPKLMDMGISKSVGEDASMTMTGVIVGTPCYMSPEQAKSEKAIDFRADIYSLGATLYHLLTGEVPFEGESSVSIMAKHVVEPLPNPRLKNPAVSKQAAALLEKMMQKLPKDRQQSWEDVIRDIDLVLSGQFPRGGSTFSAGFMKLLKRAALVFAVILLAGLVLKALKKGAAKRKSAAAQQVEVVSKTVPPAQEHPKPDDSKKLSLPTFGETVPESGKNQPPSIPDKTEPKPAGQPLPEENGAPSGTPVLPPVDGKEEEPASETPRTAEPTEKAPDVEPHSGKTEKTPDEEPENVRQPSSPNQPQHDQIEDVRRQIVEALAKVNPSFNPHKCIVMVENDKWKVDLSYNSMADIRPLKDFQKITNLGFPCTDVADISALKGLNLRTLSISNTKVKEISALKGMTELKRLELSNTDVSDLLPIAKMTSLKALFIDGTKVKNLEQISALKLEELRFSRTDISSLMPIKGMTELKRLDMSSTKVTNISVLAKLTSLKCLAMDGTDVKSIDPIMGLPLEVLVFDYRDFLNPPRILKDLHDKVTTLKYIAGSMRELEENNPTADEFWDMIRREMEKGGQPSGPSKPPKYTPRNIHR